MPASEEFNSVLGLDGKEYSFVRDSQSGFVRAVPTPSSDELRQFYEEQFYADRPKFNDSAKESRDRDREYVNWGLADLLTEFADVVGRLPRTALDIGCGYGHALDYLATRGVTAYGYEPSSSAVQHCRGSGHEVLHGLAEELLEVEPRRFDLVIANHVLEHVPDPHTLLQAIAPVIEEDGRLYVQVPNDFSPLQRLATRTLDLEPWWLCPPNHLSYFSMESLAETLRVNGFRVEACWSDFPLEFFLLQGHNYIGSPELGRDAHLARIMFERAFREGGEQLLLRDYYRYLVTKGLGRELHVLACKVP